MNEIELIITMDNSGLVTGVRTASGEIVQFGKSAAEASDKASAGFGVLQKSLQEMAIQAAGFFAAFKAGDWAKDIIKDSTLLAARVETLGVVMNVVGRNAGYSSQEMKMYADSVKAMGITTQESMQTVIRMAQANLDLAKSSQLARVAQDAAVIGNVNSSEALGRLLHGITTLQPEILRTIGITVTFEEEYKKFASTAGRTVDSLSQQEKQQIALNAVLREGEKIAGTYEGAMGTAGKQITSISRYAEEAKVKFGQLFTPALNDSVKLLSSGLSFLNDQLERLVAGLGRADRMSNLYSQLARIDEEIAQREKGFFGITPRAGSLAERQLEWYKRKRLEIAQELLDLQTPDRVDAPAGAAGSAGAAGAAVDKYNEDNDPKIIALRARVRGVGELAKKEIELQKEKEAKIAEISKRYLKEKEDADRDYAEWYERMYEFRLQREQEMLDRSAALNRQRLEMQRQEYEEYWSMVMGNANMVGGEMGKGLGMMAAGMKGITDVQMGVDPYSERLERLREYYNAEITLLQDARATQTTIEQAFAQYQIESDQITAQQRIATAQNLAGMLAGIMYSMYVATGKHNNAMFVMYKAFAATEALISTYAGAARALKDFKFPYNIAVAAIITAAGLARVAAIVSQKPGSAAPVAAVPAGGGYGYKDPNQPAFEPTQAAAQETPRPMTVTIYNYGILGTDQDKIARDLVPALQKAMDDGAH
ncbi:MAG: hypothetical protein AB1553_00615 [Nitrospirota bacterium]